MIRALGVLIGVLATAGAAMAQPRGDRGGRPGDFDFYVLALSWSPGFCELSGDRARNREQCGDGADLGFVVHGLWPQFERGFPTECGFADRAPTRIALREAEGLFPSEGLARHQWRRHGTCSGSSPADYYADTRRARQKVTIPASLQRPARDSTWRPLEIERAFAEANPGLRTDMMAVSCRRGVLQEIRICLSRDLRSFRTCQEVDRSGCRGGEVTVPAVR